MIGLWNPAAPTLDHLTAVARLSLMRRPVAPPVLVLGTPRSGTTWASRVLGLTQGAFLVHEPDNERRDPFALSAKKELGPFPALRPGDDAAWTPRLRRIIDMVEPRLGARPTAGGW